jgi:hypothetical protein
MADFQFSPASITVQVGSTVTWRNDGPSAHTATADDGTFNSGILRTGDSSSATFNQLGSYDYVCTLHPQMTGTVVVESVGSAVDDAPTSTTPDPQSAEPEDPAEPASAKHPRTGAELGVRLLLAVGLLFVGANARRLIPPARRV